MSARSGPAHWTRGLAGDVWLDGLHFEGISSLGWQPKAPSVTAIRMADGAGLVQRPFRGGTAPASLTEMTMQLALLPVKPESDHVALQRAEARGELVWFFPQVPLTDIWDAVPGQSLFSLSRFLPYARVPGATSGLYPISAWLDDTEQEVVSGTPAAGQVQLVSGVEQHGALATPPLDGGQVLRARYFAVHWVAPSIQWSYAQSNDLVGAAQLDETLVGDFS